MADQRFYPQRNNLLRPSPKLLRRPHSAETKQRQKHRDQCLRPRQLRQFRHMRKKVDRGPVQQVVNDEMPQQRKSANPTNKWSPTSNED